MPGRSRSRCALELWRGPPLHGLTDTPWFSAEARRLEALRVDALEEQFEAALALGEHREIVSALHTAARGEPRARAAVGAADAGALPERPPGGRARDRSRRRGGVLAEELGLEPGPELRGSRQRSSRRTRRSPPCPVESRRRGNLPTPTTSFVDRERELADVVELLREHRLVTLIGPPGVGKSRLALEAVRALRERDCATAGGWSSLRARATRRTSSGLVAQAVDARGADPLARVIARLRDARRDPAARRLRARARGGGARRLGGAGRVSRRPRARNEPRGASRRRRGPSSRSNRCRCPTRLRPTTAAPRPCSCLPRAHARPAGIRAHRRRRADSPPRSRVAWTGCRSRSSSPPPASTCSGSPSSCSIVERRLALLRRVSRPPSRAHGTLGGSSSGATTSCTRTRRRCSTSLPCTEAALRCRRCSRSLRSHGLDEATVTYLLGALVDKSIVSVSFPADEARYDLLDTVRDYALERLAESGGLRRCPRGARGVLRRRWPRPRGPGSAAPEWQAWMKRLELEHDNLWAALTYARDAPDPVSRSASGRRWAGTSALAERVSEGRRFLEAAQARSRRTTRPLGLRVELLAYLCFLATEEVDLEAAIEAGERGLALAGTGAASPMAAAAAGAALARASRMPATTSGRRSSPRRRAPDPSTLEISGVEPPSAVWTGAMGAAGAGDVAHRRRADRGRSLALRGDRISTHPAAGGAARGVGRRAARRPRGGGPTRTGARSRLANRAGFADHASFALAGPRLDRVRRREPTPGRSAVQTGARRRRGGTRRPGSRGTCAGEARPPSSPRPATPTPPRGCIGASSSGRSGRGRTEARESLFIALAGSPAPLHSTASPSSPTPAAMPRPRPSCAPAPGWRSPETGSGRGARGSAVAATRRKLSSARRSTDGTAVDNRDQRRGG